MLTAFTSFLFSCAALAAVGVHPMEAPIRPTDSQIAQVLMTIDIGEVRGNHLAAGQADHAGIRRFARKMMLEHARSIVDTQKVVKRNSIKLRKSKLSSKIHRKAEALERTLKVTRQDKNGPTHDELYMRYQIAMHNDALDIFDHSLIPNAIEPELRRHLEKIREHLNAHLVEAQRLSAHYGFKEDL